MIFLTSSKDAHPIGVWHKSTQINYCINQAGATVIVITTPTKKQHAVYKAISSIDISPARYTFAYSSLVPALLHTGQIYLTTATSKAEKSSMQSYSIASPSAIKQHPSIPHTPTLPQLLELNIAKVLSQNIGLL